MFLVTFGIAFGGLIACGIVALALIYFVGIENQITRICLYILIIPALISFLLGLGLGDNAFRKACARISEVDESSPENSGRKTKTGANKPRHSSPDRHESK